MLNHNFVVTNQMSVINNNGAPRKAFFASNDCNAMAASLIALLMLTCISLASISPISIIALAQTNNATTPRNSLDGYSDRAARDRTEGNGGGNGSTGITSASSGIKLSSQPVYQERSTETEETPINQTHLQITFSGNGTLNLPNGMETIRTTSIGSGISSLTDGTFVGKVILTTQDGQDNATSTMYEMGQFNPEGETGKGIAISVFHTNSTGKLAPLDEMILVGQDEFLPDGSAFITYWNWDGGIPYAKMPSLQEAPMNTTSTTTTTSSET